MRKNKSFLHRKQRSYMERQVDIIPERQSFLIVCEGEKTEPKYFLGFRVPGLIIIVDGAGMNTVSLVQKALEKRRERHYDQTWCVFDKDDNSDEQFNAALAIAKKNGIKVAYSNQSFELWYVLHFDFMDAAITRADYMKILDVKLGREYKKNCPTMHTELHDRLTAAIRNAERLLAGYPKSRPAEDDPSTTVHLLVKELLKYSGPF